MKLTALPGTTDGLKRALNESGWLDDEVVAAGQLRQGRAPSLVAMFFGFGLWEMFFRPRRCKALPRQFVLAATRDRVLAFASKGRQDEDGGTPYEVIIQHGEAASFARDEVRVADLKEGAKNRQCNVVIGGERFPVFAGGLSSDPNTDELIALLAAA